MKNRNNSLQINMLNRRRLIGLAVGVGLLPAVSVHQLFAADSGNYLYPHGVRALVFDVFGTVVDWRSSIIHEGQLLAERKGYTIDWGDFADRWRAGYTPAMNRVRSGELPWTKLDTLHRMVLDELVFEFGLTGLSEEELEHFNRAWHRLAPWPDTVPGLTRLRSKYVIATLSNGNVSLLVNMAKHAGLPWDTVLSAELSGYYKPDARAYLKAAELLSLSPEQVMLVAAHPSDLRAAAAAGLKTAYVHRPTERGSQRLITPPASEEFDMFSSDLLDLATLLGV